MELKSQQTYLHSQLLINQIDEVTYGPRERLRLLFSKIFICISLSLSLSLCLSIALSAISLPPLSRYVSPSLLSLCLSLSHFSLSPSSLTRLSLSHPRVSLSLFGSLSL